MSLRTLVLVGIFVLTALGTSDTAAQGNPVVVMKTNIGEVTIELFQDKAPISVANFLAYANDGYYSGTVFHRVIQQFMIQGGGMTADLSPKQTRDPIKNEATNGVTNARGTLSMARTNAVDSATSQFFINTVNNARSLDNSGTDARSYGYAVFGKVIEGMDVVDKIAAVNTRSQGSHQNVPVEPVLIESITVN